LPNAAADPVAVAVGVGLAVGVEDASGVTVRVGVIVGGITDVTVGLGPGVDVDGLPVNEKLHQTPASRYVAPDDRTVITSQ
jgi:hypothetical protein